MRQWKFLLTGLLLGSLLQPAYADIQTQYDQREIDVEASGASAKEALVHCEEAALASFVQILVQTEAEKQKYKAVRAELMEHRDQYVKRLKILGKGTNPDGGRFYKIRFQVQVKALRDFLIAKGVILSTQELSQQLDHPTIAVYYKDPRDQSTYATWAVERINYFLLAQSFHVVDPKVWQNLAHDDALLSQAQGSAQRLGQVMSLKANADVYIEVAIDPKIVGHSGDYTYVQTPVRVRAFEASSGEPFISKIYQRQNSKGEPEALAIKGNVDVTAKAVIEEAVAGAMPAVLADLTAHWKANLAQGKQYLLIFKNLPAAKQSELETALKVQFKDLQRKKDNEYLVRYGGNLGDLADKLETQLGSKMGFALDSFDLGKAYFVFD